MLIKCTQKDCNVLSYVDNEETQIDEVEQIENIILNELLTINNEHKSQRLLYLMKKFDKTDKRIAASIIEKLEKEKIIKVIGFDIYIEINKVQYVKERISKL